MSPEDFEFPSSEELDSLILQKGGSARVKEILEEVIQAMVKDPGIPGNRAYHRFKRTDGPVIRQTVLEAVQTNWEARLAVDEQDHEAHILFIVGPKK